MKEMISEEDCNNIKNKTGTIESEKSQKRVGESLEELSAKRCRVEGPPPPRFQDSEETDLLGDEEYEEEEEESLGRPIGEEIKGDMSMDGNEDSNESDSNDNSDASQNGLPSSNQFEEATPETRDEEGDHGGFVEDPDENSQEDEDEPRQGDEESTDVKCSSTRLKEYMNGDVLPTRRSSGGGESIDMVVSRNKSEESGDTVLQKFEREISDLRTLLLLKEREWNSILKLVKLKEITLAQLKRTKEVEGIMESKMPLESGDDYLHKLLTQIAAESIRTGSSAVHVQNSINETEKEIKDLGKQVSTNFIHTHSKGDSGNTTSDAENFFLASNALKNLVNKNKTTLTSHSIPAVPNTSNTNNLKVIGEGRQGPIVEVASLIADYRSKALAENSIEKRKQFSTPGTVPTFPPLNQSANISFSDILGRLFKKLGDKDKDIQQQQQQQVTPTIVSTKSLGSTKAKGNATPNNSVSSGATKTPMGTTLAKLLSSNNVSTSRSSSEDALSFSNKTPSNSSAANSDKTLSLANLLASSKARDDTQKKKTESQPVPLCQGCNANKAQFVCAGCANQWYCSRECQVAAWDEHSEVCSG